MLFKFRNKNRPWEVVDNSYVSPVPAYHGEEVAVASVGSNDTVGTYVFDISQSTDTRQYRRALSFSRKLLLQEVEKQGFNMLLVESWQFTILRNGPHYRVEIRYTGRPARAAGDAPTKASPPFISILDRHRLHS